MNEYTLSDRTGVIASGSLEQIRAKVHELGHLGHLFGGNGTPYFPPELPPPVA